MQSEGYLRIDHSASPGIPEDLALKLNMDPRLVGEGKILEAATITCTHCKTAFIKNPLRTREREICGKCGGKYICDACAAQAREPDYTHTPFEKQVDVFMDMRAKGVPMLGSPRELLNPPSPIIS